MPQHDTSKPRPNLFIVGAPKCGTTSLYQYLAQHPQVYFSAVKEPRYFGGDLHMTCRVRSEEEYLELFSGAGEATYIGEASVFYLRSTRAASEIKAFSPDSKILIMIRNPVEMMVSWHAQLVYSGVETVLDFKEALQEERFRRANISTCRSSFPAGLLYREMATFSPQIKRYFDVFGRNRVKVIVFDDFASDTEMVVKDVLSFLDVRLILPQSFLAANAASSKTLRNLSVRQFLDRHPASRKLLSLVPSSLRRAAANRAASLSGSQNRVTRPLDENLKTELMQEFAPEIDELCSLLERDLSGWTT